MTDLIRCISLHQPWASLIFTKRHVAAEDGVIPMVKVHETRSWPAPASLIGEELAIHAAARPMRLEEVPPELRAMPMLQSYRFPYGALLGTVRVVSCLTTEAATPESRWDKHAGDWSPGRWAWRLAEARALACPLAMKGKQGFWLTPRSELIFPPPKEPLTEEGDNE